MKFWAVTKGWSVGVFDDYMIVDKLIRNYTGAEYKVFENYEDAVKHVKENSIYKRSQKRNQIVRLEKEKKENDKLIRKMYCRSCGKPIQKKTKKNKGLCQTCLKNPKQRSKYSINSSVKKYNEETEIPKYITDLLGEDKEIIALNGIKRNPEIHYRCKRCNEEFKTKYNILKTHIGHDCTALISSGEAIVKDFLDKENIPYKTQRDTLFCKNPYTGKQMPYDFELKDKKVIIEVQGEQHIKFIERFHINEDGFKYQLEKDKIKKEFAINNGYTFVEIFYSEFKDDTYKNKIINNLK